jgi:pilus assembly protein CpaB
MKFGTVLVLFLAIVVGGVAAYLAHEIIAARPVGHATLVVASDSLKFGTELTESNVTEAPWSDSVIPAGAFTSKAELFKEGRRVALFPVEVNEPVLATRITGPNQRGGLSALIEPGMRAVTVRVDDVKGVAGFILPGDRVDIVLTRNEDRTNSYADVLLQNVRVLGIDQLANASQENASVAKAVTVEVTTEQAQKLVLAQGVGTLSLVLRKAGAENPERTRRVSSLDLGQGEFVAKADPPALAPPPPPVVTRTVRVIRGVAQEDVSVYHNQVLGEDCGPQCRF